MQLALEHYKSHGDSPPYLECPVCKCVVEGFALVFQGCPINSCPSNKIKRLAWLIDRYNEYISVGEKKKAMRWYESHIKELKGYVTCPP